MHIYKVGGAVRDRLLGLPVSDIDWLVVGATVEEMHAKGYRPVGADFPVFLHPKTGEEYALARTERKSGRGYGGFTFHASPDVTLEEDLIRRDLTINAMAEDEAGTVYDPTTAKKISKDEFYATFPGIRRRSLARAARRALCCPLCTARFPGCRRDA